MTVAAGSLGVRVTVLGLALFEEQLTTRVQLVVRVNVTAEPSPVVVLRTEKLALPFVARGERVCVLACGVTDTPGITGGLTCTETVPEMLPLVAVIVAEP